MAKFKVTFVDDIGEDPIEVEARTFGPKDDFVVFVDWRKGFDTATPIASFAKATVLRVEEVPES